MEEMPASMLLICPSLQKLERSSMRLLLKNFSSKLKDSLTDTTISYLDGSILNRITYLLYFHPD